MLFFSSIVFVHCCSVVSLIFLSVTRIVKIRFFCYPLFAFILCSHVTGKQKNCILCAFTACKPYPFTVVYHVFSHLYTMSLHSLYTMCFHCCILCAFTACKPCPFTVVYHVFSHLYTMFLHCCILCPFTVVYHVPSLLYTMCLHCCIPCPFTVVNHVPSQLYTMCLHRSGRAFFYTLEFKEIIRRITLFYGKLRK